MSRQKPKRGFNRRTTPKNGALASTHDPDTGEQLTVKWCANHERFERRAGDPKNGLPSGE